MIELYVIACVVGIVGIASVITLLIDIKYGIKETNRHLKALTILNARKRG